MLISLSNSKLGNIANWSLPAATTCPGKSEICHKLCYALKGFYRYTSTKLALNSRLKLRTEADWVANIIKEIKDSKVSIFRIHASGDFDTVTYVYNWIKIIKECPDVTFYAYTRSWNEDYLLDSLIELSKLPNMRLWWSTDASMPEPPRIDNIKIAYLKLSDDDNPTYQCDLFFRDDTSSVLKKVNNTLVCPVENGVETQNKITCEKCKFCFKNNDSRQRKI